MKVLSETNRILERCNGFDTLSAVLFSMADEVERGVEFLISGRESDAVTYAALCDRARLFLGALQQRQVTRDQEIIFQVADDRQFLTAFWACMMGGYIPAPVTMGVHEEFRQKLFKIMAQMKHPRLLTTRDHLASLKEFAESHNLQSIFATYEREALILEDLETNTAPGKLGPVRSEDIAFIQYSSGSTGDPKGVILSHHNLLANIRAMIQGAQLEGADKPLSWMPLTHDMGLIGFHLTPVAAGLHHYLMPPSRFLRNPVGWIGKAHKYQATILSSPNFGYRHFLNAFKRYTERNWDLSSVRLIMNGAEPISAELCREFMEELALFGLKPGVMLPVYGMAEASLAVTFPPLGDPLRTVAVSRDRVAEDLTASEAYTSHHNEYVDVGYAVQDCAFRLCNQEGAPVADGEVGHIQIQGENVSRGYYRNPEATEAAFTRDGWLRTGDLGMLHDGRLVVTGRVKDVIFKHGVNYYAHDLERLAEDVVAYGKTMFCGLFNQARNRNEVIAFVQVKGELTKHAQIAIDVKKHVGKFMGLEVDAVIPVAKIPRTTSGKLRRHVLIERYLQGDFAETLVILNAALAELEEQRVVIPPKTKTERRLANLWRDELQVKHVGRHDNFFELGGDSVKAGGLVVKAGHLFRTRISLEELFSFQTLQEMATAIDQSRVNDVSIITPAPTRPAYPLSSEQKRLFFLHQLNPKGIGYNLYLAADIMGDIDPEALQDALTKLVQKRKILRTTYQMRDGEPAQVIHDQVDATLLRTRVPHDRLDHELRSLMAPFELTIAPLFRLYLVDTERGQLLFLETHHIMCDGASMGIFIDQLFQIYSTGQLEDPLLAFHDYAVWQGQFRDTERYAQMAAYWRSRLQGELPVLRLRTDFHRPATWDERGEAVDMVIEGALLADLRWLARTHQTTINMVLVAVYQILLSKYTGQEDVLIGAVMAGRNHHGLESLIGMFVKTVVLRAHPTGDLRFTSFLEQTKKSFFEAHANQDYPFERVVEMVGAHRELGRNPIFDAMFVFQNFRMPEVAGEGIRLRERRFNMQRITFDLLMEVRETDDALHCSLQYAASLFRRGAIDRMARHFRFLAQQAALTPRVTLRRMRLISADEAHQVLELFNRTAAPFDDTLTVAQIFEDRARRFADLPAIRSTEETLTYDEVNRRANQIARALRREGVRPETIVALAIDPCVHMMVALIAIFKAGGAYLPIDPDFPETRKHMMLQDSGARLVLSLREHGSLNGIPPTLFLDEPDWYKNEHETNLKVQSFARDLAYVIYTSGTSGQPKGVWVEHRGLVNVLTALESLSPCSPKDIWIYKTVFIFDASIHDLFLWMMNGASCFVAEKKIDMNPERLTRTLIDQQITHALFLPSLLRLWLDHLNDADRHRLKLKFIWTGGESITASLVNRLFQMLPNVALNNGYGPTETTVAASAEELVLVENQAQPTIGRPLSNVRIYILNRDSQPQPIGVPGQICIAGAGMTRGYQNLPDLTAARFIDDPFEPGQLMYLSGDIGFWLSDGRIGFMGRADQQVKVRGLRIELEEIESMLQTHEQIIDAAVIDVRLKSDVELCAYYVSETTLEPVLLRDYLKRLLPNYMVPSYFINLPELPLTSNGKIDRKALPLPKTADIIRAEYQAPESEAEQMVVDVFQEILELDQIGVNDQFFELGGHSLLAARAMAALRARAEVNLGVATLFEAPRVQELAARIEQEKAGLRAGKELRNILASLQEEFPFAFREILCNERTYRVAYAEDLGKFEDFIKQAPDALQPHYIRVKAFTQVDEAADFAQKLGLTHLTADAETILLSECERMLHEQCEAMTDILSQHQALESYDGGHHPKWFIKRNIRSVIIAEHRFDYRIEYFELDQALKALIDKQSLLRAVLHGEGEDLVFQERSWSQSIKIPMLDLSEFDPDHQDRALELIRQRMTEQLKASQAVDALLYRFVWIRLNRVESRLLMALDHIIADYDSARAVHYHFRQLELAKRKDKAPNYDYPVNPYRQFVTLTHSEDLPQKTDQFKLTPEYRTYRDLTLDLQGRYGRGQAIVFSDPYHLAFQLPPQIHGIEAGPGATGLGLAVATFTLATLFKTEEVPLRVLTNRRIFNGVSFFHTIGDFHDSLPVVFPAANISPERAYQTMRALERKFSDLGYYLSAIGLDQEVYHCLFKSPFNFNFVGELSPKEERETLANASVFPFVSYPVFAYQRGNGLGMIFFHGLNEETEQRLRHFLAGQAGSFELKKI